MRTLRLAMAQINVTVGDLQGNAARIIQYMSKARDHGADIVVFPELAVTGYPPEDLLLKPHFIEANIKKAKEIATNTHDLVAIFGFVDADVDIFNAAAVAYEGKIIGTYHKMHLPNYGVFDEERYFKSGTECPVFIINGTSIGVNICEDIWHTTGPTSAQRSSGAEVIVNINGSPFHVGKRLLREKMVSTRASDNEVFLAYVNLVGGQDELVFDGGSVVCNPEGEIIARGEQFKEHLTIVDLDVESVFRSRLRGPRLRKEQPNLTGGVRAQPVIYVSDLDTQKTKHALDAPTPLPIQNPVDEVYSALVLGTQDYVRKCGFQKVLIALSGGIDSTLVATIAVDALGRDNVVGVAMPSRFSSEGSLIDATSLAENLGIELLSIPIEEIVTAFDHTLESQFRHTVWGLAEENIQSRCRGNLIMALSNKFGSLVLTTGNKSEMATGYATIYGDMAGGFAVIKDVPKTMVYALSKHRNTLGIKPVIPTAIIEKPPSAELRPDQKDADSLPPYSVLDPILKAYVEDELSLDQIVAVGYQKEIVESIITLVDRNEYKRRQSPPGVKITPRNFGRDRRMPIANHYRPF